MESDMILEEANSFNYLKKIKIILFIIMCIFIFYYSIVINLKNNRLLNQILKISNKLENQNGKLSEKLSVIVDDMNYRVKLLKLMTNNNELVYKGAENCLLNDPDSQLCIYHLIYPKQVIGKNRTLIGEKSDGDGSYVTLDDFNNIKIAYSFGISHMIQFDNDLANRGIDVYMYDHTINSLPYNNSKFHWKKNGICASNEKNEQLKTLEELMKENGHTSEKDMILKIDVEHWEWNALNELSEDILKQFKYLLIEFHFSDPSNNSELYYNVLKKIKKTHQVFYNRCQFRDNLVKFGNNVICQFLELSYVIREGNQFSKDETIYPDFDFDFDGPIQFGKSEMNLNILKLFDFDSK